MGFFKKFFREVARPFKQASDLGWNIIGQQSPVQKEKAEFAAKTAATEAARRAHEEEVQSLATGAEETLRARRRRGAYATILTGGAPLSYASPPRASGKTLLGQ